MSTLTTRRTALRSLLHLGVGAAALPLVRPGDALGGVVSPCPGAEVTWVPDVMHPVNSGFKDFRPEDGAPVPLRVFYPTGDIAPAPGQPAKFLEHCTARWPLVIFLNGEQPCPIPIDLDYFKSWTTQPATLARSGYVVVVPQFFPGPQNDEMNARLFSRFVDWARNDWEHASFLDPRPGSTAVLAHGLGAMTLPLIAGMRTDISAYASLGGQWKDRPGGVASLGALDQPTFFMWDDQDPSENLRAGHVWDSLSVTRYACQYTGAHFDYTVLPPGCGLPVGCRLIRSFSSDLLSLFLGCHLPVAGGMRIPLSLAPPDAPLTIPLQVFFGSLRLNGLTQMSASRDCSADLDWKTFLQSGHRHYGV